MPRVFVRCLAAFCGIPVHNVWLWDSRCLQAAFATVHLLLAKHRLVFIMWLCCCFLQVLIGTLTFVLDDERGCAVQTPAALENVAAQAIRCILSAPAGVQWIQFTSSCSALASHRLLLRHRGRESRACSRLALFLVDGAQCVDALNVCAQGADRACHELCGLRCVIEARKPGLEKADVAVGAPAVSVQLTWSTTCEQAASFQRRLDAQGVSACISEPFVPESCDYKNAVRDLLASFNTGSDVISFMAGECGVLHDIGELSWFFSLHLCSFVQA